MQDKSRNQLSKQVEACAVQAGEIIRANRDKPKQIKHKGQIDLVTDTDLQVEENLKDNLHKILPQAGFLAEETSGNKPLTDPSWIIDPLDGTTNYAHNLDKVAVSIALWRENQIELGFVYLPINEEMFFAGRNLGAYLNNKPIRVSGVSDLMQSLLATGFPYDIQDRLDEVLTQLRTVLPRCQDIRRMGAAAVDLAYTACGRLEAFFEMGLKPWDTAAGWLIVEEAGGRVTQFNPFAEYLLGADTILASNGLVHEDLIQLLKPLQR